MINWFITGYLFLAILFLIFVFLCEEMGNRRYKELTYSLLKKLQQIPFGGLIFYLIIILAGFLILLLVVASFSV